MAGGLEPGGELFTPDMPNAENAWLPAQMQTNCAGQTLHDVGFHRLLTHQNQAFASDVEDPCREIGVRQAL
ncbi:hypothetical protein BLA18109_01830 [Burkholderia lata]|uniref:Uncharacterized protein n=2 Tax=Burkholderia lata (strain ATCC 17760 / DSM 23089 / LMG 22485 / NCIMB 9086 / R18194 / 383) TaxID=482957 RepID=A0A6P2TY95_BURL3|nr:hypothetical protein BLA18109_01830 [Burkholderia lata]